MTGVLAVVLAGLAGWCWSGPRVVRPLHRPGRPDWPGRPPWWLPVAGGLVLTLAGWGLLGLPAVLAGLFGWYARRTDRARQQRDLARLRGDLMAAAPLLAACVGTGAAPAAAVAAVATAVDGAAGSLLGRVAAGLHLGAEPAHAWAPVVELGGPPARLARVFVRAAETGAPLADTVVALAEDERDRARADAEAACRRAGVRIVGPLAACFLPAFVLVGVVPVVAAIAGDVIGSL